MLNNEQQKYDFSKTDTNTIDSVAFEKYTSIVSATIEISAVLALEKKVRAGMTTIEQVNNPALHQDNRSMIAIGG